MMGARIRADGGRSIDCLDHQHDPTQTQVNCSAASIGCTAAVALGGATSGAGGVSMARCVKQEHVYESASFARAQKMAATSGDQANIGLLPVYYEVDGKLISCTGNPLSAPV